MTGIALAVAITAGVLAYMVLGFYVYLRLLWYFVNEHDLDAEFSAFMFAALLPLGLVRLLFYSVTDDNELFDRGLPPRRERQKNKIKRLEDENRRLELELKIGDHA